VLISHTDDVADPGMLRPLRATTQAAAKEKADAFAPAFSLAEPSRASIRRESHTST
jgi:hypothetical protein